MSVLFSTFFDFSRCIFFYRRKSSVRAGKWTIGFILFLLKIQVAFAGVNIVLDLDDTVLKEAPVSQKSNPLVQSLKYTPSSDFYHRYEQRLKTQSSEPGKVIHFELHPKTKAMTGYVVIRPGMAEFLKKLTKDPTNQLFVASNNDPARTEAIIHGLKIGGKTLEQWGIKAIPKEVFNQNGGEKNLPVIRKWAKLKSEDPLFAIDDLPKFYTGATSHDQVIGITPWDYKNGITEFLSGKSSKAITEVNAQELNQIWSKIAKNGKPDGLLESKAASPPKVLKADLPPQTLHAFQLPSPKIDISKSPSLSSNDEYYSSRPHIDALPNRDHSNTLPPTWSSQREGHLEAVAKLIEMYPDRHIYFLARDGELLYDIAKTALKDEPHERSRIHLLNVSRANMNDPNLLKYLAQEGISKENLEKGMKVLFVDTGFSGTIPKTISERFPEALRSKLQTHLMSSANPNHPSSRVFLESFHKGAADLDPSQLHSSIIDYEHMPRFTFRARNLKVVNGRWEPTGEKGKDSDGQVSQEKAKDYMEDLKHYALSLQGKERLKKQRDFWRRARQMLDSGQKSELEAELKNLLTSEEEASDKARVKGMAKAMVRDLVELVSRNEPTHAKLLPTSKALGLTEIGVGDITGSKLKVIQEHPEWTQILSNPATEIPKLVNGTDEEVQTLRNIIDEINDSEIKEIIAKSLYEAKATHFKKSAQTFESILDNKPNWIGVIKDHFNEQVQKNLGIVEQALQSSEPELREEGAISLSYFQGKDLLSLFEKALTHEDENVRKRATSSLYYWNPSDQKTLQMLVKLLNHPTPKIREEVASLMKTLYPHFQNKEETEPLKAYLSSDCQKPIEEVISPDKIKEALDPVLTSLSEGSDEPHPIIPVSKDDPRVTPQFAFLGNMVQVGGVIWSDVAKDENGKGIHMSQWGFYPDAPYNPKDPNATAYCKSIGGRLPTIEDWEAMGRALGYRVPGKVYNPALIPDTEDRWFWSSSVDPGDIDRAFGFGFYSYGGRVERSHRSVSAFHSVRCITGASGP